MVLHARLNGQDYRFEAADDVRIGRDSSCELSSENPVVSREHAVVRAVGDGWVLEDTNSTGGTFADGQRVTRLAITASTKVRLGDPVLGDELELAAVDGAPEAPPASAPPSADPGVRLGRLTGTFHTNLPRLRIGRDQDNDVVVDDMLVSRHHAELRMLAGGHEILDLGSHNGTYVDGRPVGRAAVDESSIIGLGRHHFRLVAGTLEQYDEVGQVQFEAAGLSVLVGEGKPILDAVSFALPENCFMAIVGPSGAGKSTLMKALTGFAPADQGTVVYNGRDLYDSLEELRSRIGYVPQDDILHPQLTVERALDFAAELRFPPDVTKAERRRAVSEVMEELGLSHRADLPIHKLSGGQRKRTSVALELITKPSLLFLDEPTSGLDPGFEKSAMELLRTLADGGRTVIVVTHSLQSLQLCDRVIFLAPGGTTAYFGPPAEALEYFGRDDYADVFRDLEREKALDWRQQFDDSRFHAAYVAQPSARARLADRSGRPAPARAPQRSWWGQLSTLVRRHLAVIAADRGLLAMLIVLAPVLGVALFAVLGSGGLRFETAPGPGGGRVPVPNQGSINVLFGLVFCVGLIGTVDSFREIVKELPIVRRERSIGLSLSAYLVSKLVVLIPFVVVQATVLTLIAVARAQGPHTAAVIHGAPLLELVLDIVLTGVAAMVVGLLISAAVTTSDKATPLMAGVVAASLLLAGALFDLRDKPVIRELSYLTTTRWGFAAGASSVDLKRLEANRCHETPNESCDTAWAHKASVWTTDVGALGGLSVVGIAGTAWFLKRRDPRAKPRSRPARAG
jgi:ABC-type multidrug transport system ATPase subunit/pSer/pThr/pTyr-binding forkhead associated (FHA) protein